MMFLEGLVSAVMKGLSVMVRRLWKLFWLAWAVSALVLGVVFMVAPGMSQEDKVLVVCALALVLVPFVYKRLNFDFMSELTPLETKVAKLNQPK